MAASLKGTSKLDDADSCSHREELLVLSDELPLVIDFELIVAVI